MRVQIAARHCEVPDPVRERAHELATRLTRYDDRAASAEVIFDEEKHTRKVEVIVSLDGAPPVVAKAEAGEFRAALDKAADRVGRMLRRGRAQLTDHQGPSLGSLAE